MTININNGSHYPQWQLNPKKDEHLNKTGEDAGNVPVEKNGDISIAPLVESTDSKGKSLNSSDLRNILLNYKSIDLKTTPATSATRELPTPPATTKTPPELPEPPATTKTPPSTSVPTPTPPETKTPQLPSAPPEAPIPPKTPAPAPVPTKPATPTK